MTEFLNSRKEHLPSILSQATVRLKSWIPVPIPRVPSGKRFSNQPLARLMEDESKEPEIVSQALDYVPFKNHSWKREKDGAREREMATAMCLRS